MNMEELTVKVGDCVIISRNRTKGSFAADIERFSNVTAVRPKSFDAGGLCFRMDGREWGGHNRVRLISPVEEENSIGSPAKPREASPLERADRAKEDAILAFLLSSRHEREWLKLGLHELRRIAALHGIPSARTEAFQASNGNSQE
jgi:hypothetical protein